MEKRRRSPVELAATREVGPVLLREGAKVRRVRKRRQWTQAELGRRASLAQATISDLERGKGGSLSLESWQQVALALALPLDLSLGRDALEEPIDAGHLALQELVLRLARPLGYARTFELPTKPSDPSHSTDVGLRNDRERRLIQVECWNVFGSVNAAARSTDRKKAEAEALAIAIGDGEPYAVHQIWVVRATRRNRALLARYPEIFAARFTASSKAWVDALTKGAKPPDEPGLVWANVAATRIYEWRPGRSSGT
jgi:transcriptional regulator with XRE-family HTH domain